MSSSFTTSSRSRVKGNSRSTTAVSALMPGRSEPLFKGFSNFSIILGIKRPHSMSLSIVDRFRSWNMSTSNFEPIVLDAYRWLSDHYKNGDRIYLLGMFWWSRLLRIALMFVRFLTGSIPNPRAFCYDRQSRVDTYRKHQADRIVSTHPVAHNDDWLDRFTISVPMSCTPIWKISIRLT